MSIPRWEDRLTLTDLWARDLANPITQAEYLLGNKTTIGTLAPATPRARKIVGYAITTICFADTTPGNWTIFAVNATASTLAQFSVNVTTTLTIQTAATVPWDQQLVFQAGDQWGFIGIGPSKNGYDSFLTVEWEDI